jgi:hypothetical protein
MAKYFAFSHHIYQPLTSSFDSVAGFGCHTVRKIQEIPHRFGKPKVHFTEAPRRLPLNTVMSQINPVHTLILK